MTTEMDGPARRKSPRISLVRTAAIRLRGDEYLCKTCDMSEEGIGIVLEGVDVSPGEPVEIDVLFDRVLKTFQGFVAFTNDLPRKKRIGIHLGQWASPRAASSNGPRPSVRRGV